MVDVHVPFADVDGSSKGTMLEKWSKRMERACAKAGIDSKAVASYKQWMIDQGFENVTEYKYKWPIGTWPKDKKAKYLGKMNRTNFLTGLEGFSLRLWRAT